MSRIRVVVADDQTLVREGICKLLSLSPEIEVVGEAGDGLEALRRIRELAPDVALIDVRMPGMTGIEVIQRLHTDGIAVAAVLLTTFDDPEQAIDGIRAGARGYLLKDVSRSQLQEAIEIVAGGGSLVQPAVTERVLRGLSNLGKKFDGGAGQEPLSGRERGVLRLVAGGFSNREIAKALDLSEGTVKNHVSNVLTKLGVRDRTRAVLKAADLGWL